MGSDADNATVIAALLHDIGWKLSRCTPFHIDVDANTGAQEPKSGGTLRDIMDQTNMKGSLAKELEILTLCGSEGAGQEQQQA